MDFSEKLLYHIWDAQHIVKKPMTVSGKQVQVMFQGQWNTDFGPDFRNCILNIDGEILRGSVELHLKTYDWTAHKHSEDANFNDVILHAVYQHNGQLPYTITEDGKSIEILEIQDYLDQDIAKLIKKFEQREGFYPELCSFFGGMELSITELILYKLGINRMEKKIKRYAAELFFSDFNQLLYQGIMESGGYSKNSYNMLQIAFQFPYVALLQWKEEGMTLAELQAILILGNNLKDHIPKTIPQALREQWRSLYDSQQFTATTTTPKWNLFRVRPVNHPVVRIMQIANFIYRTLEDGLLPYFIDLFSADEDKLLKNIVKKLVTDFNDEALPSSLCIGSNRIDISMINVIIPVLILYADKTNNQSLKKRAWDIYKTYPGLTPNYIEKYMKQKYMLASQQMIIRKRAVHQQGLLKLYYEYCRYHNCQLCQTHKRDMILSM